MERFDVIEFDVLEWANSGMYSKYKKYVDRALLLMDLGIFKHNPKENWVQSGWTLTKAGLKYRKEFLQAVRENHGHDWETHNDNEDEEYREDTEYGNAPDSFAYSVGYHNGYRCKKCGFTFCKHCDSEFELERCGAS